MAPRTVIINNYNIANKIINNGSGKVNNSELKKQFKKLEVNDDSDTDYESNSESNSESNNESDANSDEESNSENKTLIDYNINPNNELLENVYSYANPSHSKYICRLIKEGFNFPISDYYNKHVLYAVIIQINTEHNYVIIKFGYSNNLEERLKCMAYEYKSEIFFIRAKIISCESDEMDFHRMLRNNYNPLIENFKIKNTNKVELYKFHPVLLEEFDKFKYILCRKNKRIRNKCTVQKCEICGYSTKKTQDFIIHINRKISCDVSKINDKKLRKLVMNEKKYTKRMKSIILYYTQDIIDNRCIEDFSFIPKKDKLFSILKLVIWLEDKLGINRFNIHNLQEENVEMVKVMIGNEITYEPKIKTELLEQIESFRCLSFATSCKSQTKDIMARINKITSVDRLKKFFMDMINQFDDFYEYKWKRVGPRNNRKPIYTNFKFCKERIFEHAKIINYLQMDKNKFQEQIKQ